MVFILFAFRYHVHGAPSLLTVAESNFRWNVHFFHPPPVSGPFAQSPALSPLSLSPCLLLLWCCSLHSSTLSVLLHVTMYQQERFPSDPARAKTALRAVTNWNDDGGGHEPKTAHCILTEWAIKISLSFSISSAEMQSLDSSVTVLQRFENITRALLAFVHVLL